MLHKYDCIASLMDAGISHSDAQALRRISMTLHRWHELECGYSNDYLSVCITRGEKVYHKSADGKTISREFKHDENGKPFLERHLHSENFARYTPVPDRERGALKRLAKIMERYPAYASYVQTDPRGCSLYILTPDQLASLAPDVAPVMRPSLDLSAIYSRGIAVCK